MSFIKWPTYTHFFGTKARRWKKNIKCHVFPWWKNVIEEKLSLAHESRPFFSLSKKDLVCMRACECARVCVCVCVLVDHSFGSNKNERFVYVCCLLIFEANSQQFHCLPIVNTFISIYLWLFVTVTVVIVVVFHSCSSYHGLMLKL